MLWCTGRSWMGYGCAKILKKEGRTGQPEHHCLCHTNSIIFSVSNDMAEAEKPTFPTCLQNPWIPKKGAHKVILIVNKQRQKEYSAGCQIECMMRMLITGAECGNRPVEEGQGLHVGLFFFYLCLNTLTVTINTQKFSSECSGARAYGTFDFVCV